MVLFQDETNESDSCLLEFLRTRHGLGHTVEGRRGPQPRGRHLRELAYRCRAPGARLHGGRAAGPGRGRARSEEHTSELQSQSNLVCRLLLEKKKKTIH